MGTSLTMPKARGNSLKQFLWEDRFLLAIMVALTAFIFVMKPAYAGSTLFDAANELGSVIISNLKRLYCQTIFPIAAILTCISMAITKDDKKMGMLKTALITEIAVFFVILGINFIMETVKEWMTKSGGNFDVGSFTASGNGN